uniref:Putative ovule protein n=1 Tax=Solanum chacoense TaxID=4108 RepID=A0A0V0GTE6_SOLCH
MVTKMKIALVLMTILAVLPGNIVAVDHIVGDTMGWTIPSGGATTYANWASGRTFRVGDTLGMYVFNTSFSYTW